MQKTTDGKIALVALIAFAAWLLIVLPLLYLPGQGHSHGEILGVKYGEWLLFLATMALFWATWRLVNGAERTAERQLRAYVMIRTVTVTNLIIGGDPDAAVTIKNSGQTPASDMTHWARMGFPVSAFGRFPHKTEACSPARSACPRWRSYDHNWNQPAA
jgi:hypothetical protein